VKPDRDFAESEVPTTILHEPARRLHSIPCYYC
jgi:hypothetical protein